MKLELYHYWRSGASWRVRWALEIKRLAFVSHHVDLLKGEEKQPGFLARNPAGYLPCLLVDGKQHLAESLAIIEWLEESCAGANLLPKDPFRRALARQIAETVNAGIQPLQNLDVIKRYSEDKEKQADWSRHWITRGLGVVEQLLQGVQGGKFALGDEPLLPDLCLIPQCYSAVRNELSLDPYPRVKRIYENALALESCQKAHPDSYKPKA